MHELTPAHIFLGASVLKFRLVQSFKKIFLSFFFFLHRFASSTQTVAQTTFAEATLSFNTSSAPGRNIPISRMSMNHLQGVCVFWEGGSHVGWISQRCPTQFSDSLAASLCHQGGRHFHHHTIQGGHRPGDHGDQHGRRSCAPGSPSHQTPRHAPLHLHYTCRTCELWQPSKARVCVVKQCGKWKRARQFQC